VAGRARAVAHVGVDPAFWAGRTVLLTGHTGFKGAWLALWLMRTGARVVGLGLPAGEPSLFAAARVGELVEHHEVDVRDREAVQRITAATRPDVVLHLAAQAYVRRSYAEPVETYAVNVMGTAHVLDAVRTTGTARAVVVVSSDKCYDNSDAHPERPFVETDPMGGHDPYSSSKGATELVTDAFRRSFFADPDGPQVGSGRAGNVIGGSAWARTR
jgi:CDP-glucose 4,6-dehydratase